MPKQYAIMTRTGPRQAVKRNFFLGQTETSEPAFFETIREHWPWFALGAVFLLLAMGKK